MSENINVLSLFHVKHKDTKSHWVISIMRYAIQAVFQKTVPTRKWLYLKSSLPAEISLNRIQKQQQTMSFVIFAVLRDRDRATKKDDAWRRCVQVYLLVYGTIFQGSKHNS